MTSTLTPACPLCGLRYENMPLLELHIREDHRRQPRRRRPSGTGVSRSPAGSPSRGDDRAAESPRTTKEVTAMTATRHRRGGQVMAAVRRALRALRSVNDELIRASEAIARPARVPRSRPRAQAPRSVPAHPGHATERADRAA